MLRSDVLGSRKRSAQEGTSKPPVWSSPLVKYDDRLLCHLQRTLGNDGQERLRAVYFGPGRCHLTDETVAGGGMGSLHLRFRPIAERALRLGASGLLLAHNHPSGICRPSEADIATTRHVARIAASLDIQLLDHLIITPGRAYSMRAGGLL